ncbi:glycosyl hydrolase-related protein [Jiangella sp. DSM 45060]|uniref:glycoside hydrolase family 38 N-terminal domain-containing protein n=1 Tax=Jiangella sp. DSM 45060 TaxID=1798224 RepID=UPI00087C6B5C|nr:glycosyl hydrolase-related protein [Jiangella sp. DSM 45060]SDT34755.1 alpha-mannosidase [Jiangella sp. DSM 45060]
MTEPEIVLVPHTHWDREWYEPFQVFRLKLADVLDDVIERAETDPDFRFTLDGQFAAVDDYLELRPENRHRVAELVRQGRLSIGPWYILLDEFLCSGETIVRNLELGWQGAEALGGAMPVGYLPDMFGHTAQVPQLLARAGIEHAALWRGAPGALTTHGFRWEAPDGSSVRVEYLFDGYGNALDLFAIPSRLGPAVDAYRAETRSWFGADPVLGMLGTDHSAPRPDLMDLVRGPGGAGLTVSGLAEYVTRFRPDDPGLPVVVGELRSHARGNILPGVISIRVGLKQAMARAERVVGEAEALAAQFQPSADYREAFLLAWRKIVESTAHDSVTGCGVDETAAQVAARLAEAEQAGRAVRTAVLRSVAARVPADAHAVVNTVPWPRTVLAELDVPAPLTDRPVTAALPDGTALPVQELSRSSTLLGDEKLAAADLDKVIRRIHGRELFGQQIESYAVTPGTLDFAVARVPSTPEFDLAALRAELAAAAAHAPGEWRVRTVAQQRRRVLAAVQLDASGQVAVRTSQDSAEAGASGVEVTDRSLTSADVRVDVADDGTLTVRGADGTELSGVGRLVSGGDRGDSYNYGPPAADVLVEKPSSVIVTVDEGGPLRGVLRVVRRYDWPVSLSADLDVRAAETVPVEVTTLVELRAGEPYVRLDVSFVNPARDHRVRLHVPLPAPVTESAADGQFAVTARGLTSEGGWGEYPLPTFPASAFVSAGPATVLLDHVTEYELAGDGAELALTLLRAVGWMSVNLHPLRDEPAGSEFPVPGAQYVGVPVRARLAVVPRAGGWGPASAPRLAEEFRHDAQVVPGLAAAGGELPPPSSGLGVSGPGVVASSIRSRGDETELRLVAMSAAPTTATVTGAFVTAWRTDLLGRALEPLPVDGDRVDVELGPWEIATIRVS